ncbi:MAG TPA: hypothetical protein VKM56_15195 [Verrucomicrobiae bacterium]|nr:hypothetical protein [Verrucomicrobiae bacterium]
MQTKDGEVLRGQIRISPNGVTIINAAKESSVTVGLANLSDLFFDSDSEPQPDRFAKRTRQIPAAEWQAEDIGYADNLGSVEVASGLFRVRSVGTNIAGHSDAFHFVYRPCDGNCEIVTRVINAQPFAGSKAGIMIREKLTADSANVFLGLSANHGGVFQYRDGTGERTEMESRAEMFVPYWLRLKRHENEFTASASRNGTHWVRCERVALPMSEHVWIGLAAAAGQEQIAGIATMDNVAQDVIVPQTSFVPRLHLQSGSVVVGPILSGDSSSFSVRSFPYTVPASSVSHVLFRWLPFRYNLRMGQDTAGLLLRNGQFIEGSLNDIEDDKLTLSSVLFGVKAFDADSEVLALILRRPGADVPSRFTVVTVNGTTLRGKNLQFGDYQVSFNEDSLGPCKLTMPELLWLRCAP